jgi:hypothetical protein
VEREGERGERHPAACHGIPPPLVRFPAAARPAGPIPPNYLVDVASRVSISHVADNTLW